MQIDLLAVMPNREKIIDRTAFQKHVDNAISKDVIFVHADTVSAGEIIIFNMKGIYQWSRSN